MKRRLSLLAALIFAVCALVSGAHAVDIDLASLTTNELVSLRDDIDSELSSRTDYTWATLYPTTMIVGEDIRAGTYLLTNIDAKGDSIYTYPSIEDEKNRNGLEWIDLGQGETARIRLKDGMVFIVQMTCRIEAAPGFQFAP